MKKLTITVAAIVLLFILVAQCGKSDLTESEQVAVDFYEAVLDGDDEAVEFLKDPGSIKEALKMKGALNDTPDSVTIYTVPLFTDNKTAFTYLIGVPGDDASLMLHVAELNGKWIIDGIEYKSVDVSTDESLKSLVQKEVDL
ncbi:hypothetical protein [Laceyella tengchongensis]|uniref:hypothetical protein n=1 Tax=Laceyella tengchongensis TaxID=574699 RepID=UPI0012B94D49|nr:hypothetical protein [Laceyella tengchongensis]